jgi:hypothetical protein
MQKSIGDITVRFDDLSNDNDVIHVVSVVANVPGKEKVRELVKLEYVFDEPGALGEYHMLVNLLQQVEKIYTVSALRTFSTVCDKE